jgi:hypothetical protein
MKRSQKVAQVVSGCPACHKPATVTSHDALRSIPPKFRVRYACVNPRCDVVEFTVDRLSS